MTSAIKMRRNHLSGGSFVSDNSQTRGLSAILRGFAIDLAQRKFLAGSYSAPTDSSGGTNSVPGLTAVLVPTAAFDASSAGGVTSSAMNTQLALVADGIGQMSVYMNTLRVPLSLDALTGAGVTGSVGTIAAQAGSATAGTGSGTPTYASAAASLTAARNNFAVLARAANEIAAALDVTRLTDSSGGVRDPMTIIAVPATSSSADGVLSMSKINVDAALLSLKNNIKTLTTFVATCAAVTQSPCHVVAAD